MPDSVSVSAPVLVSAPPLPLMTPANVPATVWLTVSCDAPSSMAPPVSPPPDSEPMVSESVTSSRAPVTLAIVTAPVSESAVPPCTSRVPALIVVPPL